MPTTLISDTWRKPLGWVSVTAVVLLTALTIAVHGSTTAFDTWTFRELYSHIGTGGASTLAEFSSPALSIGLLGVVVVLAALLRRWDVAALAAIGPAVAVGLTKYVLKPAIDRPLTLNGYTVYGVFPSGHETAVASSALVLLIVACRLPLRAGGRAVVAVVLAIWMALAAVGLVRNFWHSVTDTIGGWCVAVAVVCAVALAIDSVAARVRGTSRLSAGVR